MSTFNHQMAVFHVNQSFADSIISTVVSFCNKSIIRLYLFCIAFCISIIYNNPIFLFHKIDM